MPSLHDFRSQDSQGTRAQMWPSQIPGPYQYLSVMENGSKWSINRTGSSSGGPW